MTISPNIVKEGLDAFAALSAEIDVPDVAGVMITSAHTCVDDSAVITKIKIAFPMKEKQFLAVNNCKRVFIPLSFN